MTTISRQVIARAAAAVFISVVFLISYQEPANANVRQYALVIGIDNYKFGTDDLTPSPDSFNNLKGARNDALRIADALKQRGVVLPDENVLIDEQATLSAFRAAWQRILNQSSPGDLVILTFAGHGGQEREVSPPIDEGNDYLDETMWFWEFDKRNPERGRLVDDELFKMFELASDRQILFVADSCHSAGLTRSMDRSAGVARADLGFMLQLGANTTGDNPAMVVTEPEEDFPSLQHVTYLTATANEANVVTEVPVDDRPHGALSVSFAEAMEGRADTNDDKVISRRELASYIEIRVKALANDKQEPGFMPRGASTDPVSVFSLIQGALSRPEQSSASTPLSVSFNGMERPNSLSNVRVSESASLVFEPKGDNIIAYFDTDEIHRWSKQATPAKTTYNIQRLVDKFRLLKIIDDGFNIRQSPLDLSLNCKGKNSRGHCNNEHKFGESVVLRIDQRASDSQETANGQYFVLFNLAGSGILQNQYPIFQNDSPTLRTLPYTLPFTVSRPFGRDDFVALFCKSDPKSLKSILARHDQMSAPDPQILLAAIKRYDCQVNRLAAFTAL